MEIALTVGEFPLIYWHRSYNVLSIILSCYENIFHNLREEDFTRRFYDKNYPKFLGNSEII